MKHMTMKDVKSVYELFSEEQVLALWKGMAKELADGAYDADAEARYEVSSRLCLLAQYVYENHVGEGE